MQHNRTACHARRRLQQQPFLKPARSVLPAHLRRVAAVLARATNEQRENALDSYLAGGVMSEDVVTRIRFYLAG